MDVILSVASFVVALIIFDRVMNGCEVVSLALHLLCHRVLLLSPTELEEGCDCEEEVEQGDVETCLPFKLYRLPYSQHSRHLLLADVALRNQGYATHESV